MREAGVEADDVIGTIAQRSRDEGALVSIATIDKDFKQLLDARLRLVQPSKEAKGSMQFYSVCDFDDEFQVHNNCRRRLVAPSRFIDNRE